jgi:hypothetical protein
MKLYFQGLEALSKDKRLDKRLQFMLGDLIALRKNRWVTRRKEDKAKKISEVHAEIRQEEQQQAMESRQMQHNSRRGGGRGPQGGPPRQKMEIYRSDRGGGDQVAPPRRGGSSAGPKKMVGPGMGVVSGAPKLGPGGPAMRPGGAMGPAGGGMRPCGGGGMRPGGKGMGMGPPGIGGRSDGPLPAGPGRPGKAAQGALGGRGLPAPAKPAAAAPAPAPAPTMDDETIRNKVRATLDEFFAAGEKAGLAEAVECFTAELGSVGPRALKQCFGIMMDKKVKEVGGAFSALLKALHKAKYVTSGDLESA